MTPWLILLLVWVAGIPAVVFVAAALGPRWIERRALARRPAATVHELRRPQELPARRRALP